MATFPTSTTLSKLHQALSRRSLMREMAAAGMLAAVPVAAVAATERKYETEGPVPADDMLPRHREVREVVHEIEQFGHSVILFGGGICIGFGGPHHEPIELWSRFNALDRKLLVEWLRLSGRVEPKSDALGSAVQS